MIKTLVEGEKTFLGLVSSNAVLAGVHAFLQKYQLELNSMLTILQIIVAVVAIIHVIQKWIKSRKKKNEKPFIPPVDSP